MANNETAEWTLISYDSLMAVLKRYPDRQPSLCKGLTYLGATYEPVKNYKTLIKNIEKDGIFQVTVTPSTIKVQQIKYHDRNEQSKNSK